MNIFKTSIRYFYTLKGFEVLQLIYLVIRRLQKKPKISPNLNVERRSWQNPWNLPGNYPQGLLEICEDRGLLFCFLNEARWIKNRDDWNDSKIPKLWLYNLHYLNDLNSIDTTLNNSDLQLLMKTWMNQNPPSVGNAWEPYPVSIRIINLIIFCTRNNILNNDLDIWIDLHAQFLIRRVEYHIQGNHLFTNAKALIFVGAYLKQDKFLDKGIKILESELEKQFLGDGAHFELSPMYHAILMNDILELLHLIECSSIQRIFDLKRKLIKHFKQGLEWLRIMSHPDNQVSFFNDTAFGIALTEKEMRRRAQFLGGDLESRGLNDQATFGELTSLENSGYHVFTYTDQSKIIMDFAKLGPCVQPGHSHADSLSFELSVKLKRFFVNSGTSTYENDKLRSWQRGTCAHNTIALDNKNSSDTWSAFRLGRRAEIKNFSIRKDRGKIIVQGDHNGYSNMFRDNILCSRKFELAEQSILIQDQATGFFVGNMSTFFYLHPDVKIIRQEDSKYCLKNDDVVVCLDFEGQSEVSLNDSFWYPEFGKKFQNKCLKVIWSSVNNGLITKIVWK